MTRPHGQILELTSVMPMVQWWQQLVPRFLQYGQRAMEYFPTQSLPYSQTLSKKKEASGEDGLDDDAEKESTYDDHCPGIHRLKTVANSVHLIGVVDFFEYVSSILSLARMKVMSC
ncbi:hypothetical protein DPMN_137898 [Dreissena polymorpha]|uniref:Uncharacterized protein n=1 Tax=Dreissena polymorpha TaxID=45954 RepID=A0A9D4JF41_DREPO|nr:hypothetical protein DPMN_137898 [Dreissena polymorpha]